MGRAAQDGQQRENPGDPEAPRLPLDRPARLIALIRRRPPPYFDFFAFFSPDAGFAPFFASAGSWTGCGESPAEPSSSTPCCGARSPKIFSKLGKPYLRTIGPLMAVAP